MPSRARCGVLASNLLCFCLRVDKLAARVALGSTVAYKVDHNSAIESITGKVEGPGPAPIEVELEHN